FNERLHKVQYQPITNNKIPQRSIGPKIWFGTQRVGSSKSLSPDPSISRPSLDNQRDGHTYRLYACTGAGSSHCDGKGSGWRSGRWWWGSRTSAAANAQQHNECASRKDPAWNVPSGSVPISKENHYEQADGPQRPGPDAKVGPGRPQRRPGRQLAAGGG